jgi:hypothetical protein
MGLSSLKGALRWLIKMVIRHPLSSVAVVVLLLVGFVFYSGLAPQPMGAQAGGGLTAPVVSPKGDLPAPAATEDFMKGQAAFNGELVWNALSNELHQSLSTQGGGRESLQEQLEQYRQEGRRLDSYTYVGGYSPNGDKSFYFYVATIRRPELGGQPDQVFFAFTLNPQGKIVSVE